MKPVTFAAPNHIISVSTVKAKFGFKKDYLTVQKNGYVVFEFIPMVFKELEKRNQLLWQDKDSFILDFRRSAELLMIDLKSKEEYFIDFTSDRVPKKRLKIYGGDTNAITFEYESEINSKNVKLVNEISKPEFLILQKLIDYSIPYMLGWHVLGSNKVPEEDILKTEEN